jgi:hypothetical protein
MIITGSSSDGLDLLALRLQSLLITINTVLSLIYTIHSPPLYALGFSISTSRLLAMDLNTGTRISNHYEVFLSSLTIYSSVLICTQLMFTIH